MSFLSDLRFSSLRIKSFLLLTDGVKKIIIITGIFYLSCKNTLKNLHILSFCLEMQS